MAEWKKPVRIHVDGEIEAVVPIWDGMLAVEMVCADKDPVWYIADTDKGELRRSEYRDVIPFSKETGSGWVESAEDEDYHLMNGRQDTGMRAKRAGEFCEGLAWFLDDQGLYGYCAPDGRIIFDAQYEFADDFHNGYAHVEDADEKAAFLHKSGRLYKTNSEFCSKLIDGTYIEDQGWKDGKERFAVKSLKTGKTLSAFACSDALDLYEWDGGGLLSVIEDDSWMEEGQIRRSGKRFFLYRQVSPTHDSVLKRAYPDEFLKQEWVRPMGREGYISRIGGRAKYVFEQMTEASDFGLTLKDAWPFYHGMARVMDEHGRYHYINRQGKYQEGGLTLLEAYDFKEAFAPVRLTSGWAIVDRKLNLTSSQRYESMEKMAGVACVLRDQNGRRFLIDLRGEEAWQQTQPESPAPAVRPAKPAKPARPEPKQKIWSLSSFAEGLMTPCAYDEGGDKDREMLQKGFSGDAWLQCGSVQQAEDVLYAYMEKKEKLPARVAWKDEAQRCVHYTLRKTPADGTQVLVKLVSGEQGVFLRLYHRKGFVLTDAAKKAPAFRPLPRMEEAVLGAPAQNISPAARPGWSASGEHMAKRYAYAEYAALEEALRVCEASLQTGCGLAAEEPAYSESENGETEGYIVFRDESRPWCNTIRFAGAGAGCAAALVFDTGKNMLEVYLSSRYRDWYTQNGT